mmetsp:Transcript_12424/g.48275  ORF Transcript_12424/g.48275 Transcript_12424/m.48275 type:complete len:276 (-) Transcript_12424:231-1058(-)
MWKWSVASPHDVGNARFVCICVDRSAQRTAKEFQKLYFDGGKVLNTLIDCREDFPTFQAQLGCQGLIVLDANGIFATSKSPPFLQFRGQAFEYVEKLLQRLANEESRSVDKEGGSLEAQAPTRPPPAVACCNGSCARTTDDTDAAAPQSYDLPSTGHDAMDAEHAELTAAMIVATSSSTLASVTMLRDIFAAHASHEERLMRDSGFGESHDAGFSAMESHAKDHAAICDAATRAMKEADVDGIVPKVSVRALCARIVEHAEMYDALYEGRLTVAT